MALVHKANRDSHLCRGFTANQQVACMAQTQTGKIRVHGRPKLLSEAPHEVRGT
jgi:hypothetical protein